MSEHALPDVPVWSAVLDVLANDDRVTPQLHGFVNLAVAAGIFPVTGVPLPLVEPGILASVVVIGLLVALAVRIPVAASAALVGLFALFHGHAHGAEMGSATAFAYMAGFAIATALLHLAGVGLGLVLGGLGSLRLTRLLGAATAAAGLVLMVQP